MVHCLKRNLIVVGGQLYVAQRHWGSSFPTTLGGRTGDYPKNESDVY